MTGELVHFIPRDELDAHGNLQAFVELCRSSIVLDARTQFDNDRWIVGRRKGMNTTERATFSTLDAATKGMDDPMPQPFRDFSKACIVYLQSTRPLVSQGQRLAALRCLEAALRERSKDARPTAVDVEVLDSAAALAAKHYGIEAAYRVAGQLQLIAKLMRDKRLVTLSQEWVHSLRRPRAIVEVISAEAEKIREERLPSPRLIEALGIIFQTANEPRDVLVSSYTAVMLCAPERVNEVLRLKRSCFVEGDRRFSGKLGLRWSGSKGFEDDTKWIPSEMAPVAKQAINNLLKVTQPAHELACWYSSNPDKVYLHPGARHLRSLDLLSAADVANLLWGDPDAYSQARTWASSHGVNRVERGKRVFYRFVDVQSAVIAMLPSTFPSMPGDVSLRCEDAIAVMRTNEVHESRATYVCMFCAVDYNTIATSLGSIKDGRDTIFSRFDFTEDDGSAMALRSHALRHYLNMVAHDGGLSAEQVALFSGRKDIGQNRAYDHFSGEERQAPISIAIKRGFTGDLVPEKARQIVLRSEFRSLGLATAHTTEYGWCTHNFASEPCQRHRDCINCEEQVCVKGERHKQANLNLLKDETEYLLERARIALSEEEYGADAWVLHQTRTLARVNQLLVIMENESTPVGAVVRLDSTPLELPIVNESRAALTLAGRRRGRNEKAARSGPQ